MSSRSSRAFRLFSNCDSSGLDKLKAFPFSTTHGVVAALLVAVVLPEEIQSDGPRLRRSVISGVFFVPWLGLTPAVRIMAEKVGRANPASAMLECLLFFDDLFVDDDGVALRSPGGCAFSGDKTKFVACADDASTVGVGTS